ncbi:MAG: hypothetical protein U0R71_00965 [Solirubrobacterales bacterium]
MALLTTAEVAAEVQMSEEWVRAHAAELGAIRAGRTARAPLRFEPEAIESWKLAHRIASPVLKAGRRRRIRHSADGVELLPLPPATERGRR